MYCDAANSGHDTKNFPVYSNTAHLLKGPSKYQGVTNGPKGDVIGDAILLRSKLHEPKEVITNAISWVLQRKNYHRVSSMYM